MSLFSVKDAAQFVGSSIDSLKAHERAALEGLFVAFELYSPQTLPLRRIEAVGSTAADCARELAAGGRDPRKFEFELVRSVYA